jgi:hypothetical protein
MPENPGGGPRRYPRLVTELPRHLEVRLQAAATVLRLPAEALLEQALERRLSDLSDEQRELVDRVASETVMRTERE